MPIDFEPVRVASMSWLNFLRWIAIILVGVIYAFTITPGHVFEMDDFAAYMMHAANLVDGHSYTDTHYVVNPEAIGFVPAQGYPPVYPLILASVYKIWGFNLRAMKLMTVLSFAVFLALLVKLFGRSLPHWANSVLVLLVGFNLVFWAQRNYLLSEFPYLMFSCAALLAGQEIYRTLQRDKWAWKEAVLLALLIYGAYGTRTVGIVLIPALLLADLCRFRRPSKFVMMVVPLALGMIALQNLLILSPKAYVDGLHVTALATWQHVIFYGKTLSYVWRNGSSKPLQIVFALLFTGLAGLRLTRRTWTYRSVVEFYVLGYLTILMLWTSEIGMRGLIPVIPFYFAFGLEEFVLLSSAMEKRGKVVLSCVVVAAICVTCAGGLNWNAHQPRLLDVTDPEAQQLFAYLQQNTAREDLLVFQKPRTLALYANRNTTMLAPGEALQKSEPFLAEHHAQYLIQNATMSYPIREMIEAMDLDPIPVFNNGAFQVYRIKVTK